MIESCNPATGQMIRRYEEPTETAVDAALSGARAAQREWAAQSVSERLPLLRRVAGLLRRRKDDLAPLASLEMGKPLTEALAEIEKCAWCLEFYADAGPDFLRDEVVSTNAADSRVVYQPLGLVLAIMPWNYPFWQVIRAAAPILVGGNGLVLKHASNVPGCALAIESVFADAGFPTGLVTALLVGSGRVAGLIADQRIAAITFTGSTPAGRSIASEAGRAIKKQVLELGGSDPFIVLADADILSAAKAAVRSRFQNTGQSCIAAKRFIVQAEVADDFVDAVLAEVDRLVVGDPFAEGVTQGSMARANLRDELDTQVQASVREGARLLRGGKGLSGPGAFYAPTVLDGVTPEMTAAREETFGPAAAIMRARDAAEAVRIANDASFGLGAAVWTADNDRGAALARQLEAGAVFVNGMVASDPRLPFGGVKESGYGRELGVLGVREFTNAKTIWTGPARL
jgi:succinate-semialdehyde dehydrogenase/glutarate-semialdehyde dehydrogenase